MIEAMQKEVLTLHQNGIDLKTIAKKLNLHHLTVYNFLKKLKKDQIRSPPEKKEVEEIDFDEEPRQISSGGTKMTLVPKDPVDDFWKSATKIEREEVMNEWLRARNERMRVETERMKNPQPAQQSQQQVEILKKEPESEMMKMFREMQQLKMMSKVLNSDESANPQIQMLMQQINDLKTELKSKDRDNSFMEAMKMNQSNMVNPERWLESQERLSEKHLQLIAERQKMEIDRLRDELKGIAKQKENSDVLGNTLTKKISEYLEKNVDVGKILGNKVEEEKSLLQDPEFIKTLVQGGLGFMNNLRDMKSQQSQQVQQVQQPVTYYPQQPPVPAGAYPVQNVQVTPLQPNGHTVSSLKNNGKMSDLDLMNVSSNEVQSEPVRDLSGFETNFLKENPV